LVHHEHSQFAPPDYTVDHGLVNQLNMNFLWISFRHKRRLAANWHSTQWAKCHMVTCLFFCHV